jgi:acyl-[acyl-carrier-protein]-phospholipid O-acyltransferase / long-chain-fatty-acid--[acyl-carrier-protein] ligase
MMLDGETRVGVRIVRTFLRFLVASLYRIEIRGGENVPQTGPVLFVSNHLSYADPMVISAATPKPIRFLMWRSIFEWKPLKWFFVFMREIPISPDDSPRQLVASLKEARHALEQGERVGLFAEGAISRFSQTRGFRNGMEHIMKGLDAVIIPTHIDRMWGSIFSFEQGKFIWKWPRLRRLPITISFGQPLPSSTRTYEVRQAVMELGAAAFEHRLRVEKPLQEAFLLQAKKRWTAPCLVDIEGKTVFTYGQLAMAALVLGRRLRRMFRHEKSVAVLFPASPSSILSMLAILFAGKTPVPLDPSFSKEKLDALCTAGGVTHILTSRKVVEELNFKLTQQVLFLDDVRSTSRFKQWAIMVLSRFLPRLPKKTQTAAVLFSAATEQAPTAIPVDHSAITACLLGLQEVLAINSNDTVASALSVSDTLAFTTALWWPLLHGSRIKHTGDHVLVEKRFALTQTESHSPERRAVPHLNVYTPPMVSMVCVSALDVHEEDEKQDGGKKGTVGRPLPGIGVRIVDPQTGQLLPPGSVGLLHVKNRATEKMPNVHLTEDGWFNTGDIASCDDEGFVTFPRRLEKIVSAF